MNHQSVQLEPGLYFVATPIGNARDITMRALDILASADAIAAEDTRSMRRLLDIHGVSLGDRPLMSYHDHSGKGAREKLLGLLRAGKSVAYASEAGTPLIADPGYQLAVDVAEAGFPVTSAPGPTALGAALTLAGLPTDAFFFAGFLPNAKSQRKTALQALGDVPGTLVLYESPKRVAAALQDAADVLGADRRAALCRELTKKFEEVRRGSLSELAQSAAEDPPRGEIVLLIDRQRSRSVNESDILSELAALPADTSVRDAADIVSTALGVPRRKVYQLALAQARKG